MESLVSLFIHPNKSLKGLVFGSAIGFYYPSSLVFRSGSAIDVVSNIMEALVSLHIHPNKPTKWLVFGSAIYFVCNMMEAFVSVGIHPKIIYKDICWGVDKHKYTSSTMTCFISPFHPSLLSNPPTYRRIIATSWSNC